MKTQSVFRISFLLTTILLIVISTFAGVVDYHSVSILTDNEKTVSTPENGGIVEEIPAKFLQTIKSGKRKCFPLNMASANGRIIPMIRVLS